MNKVVGLILFTIVLIAVVAAVVFLYNPPMPARPMNMGQGNTNHPMIAYNSTNANYSGQNMGSNSTNLSYYAYNPDNSYVPPMNTSNAPTNGNGVYN